MVLGPDGAVWMEGEEQQDSVSSWTRATATAAATTEPKEDEMPISGGSLSAFKSILDTEWFMNSAMNPPQDFNNSLDTHQEIRGLNCFSENNLLLQQIDPQAFTLNPSQSQQYLSLPNNSHPFVNGFDLGSEAAFIQQLNHGSSFMGLTTQICAAPDSDFNGFSPYNGFEGLDGLFFNSNNSRPKTCTQPTLFEKRAALRQSSGKLENLEILGANLLENKCNKNEEASVDISGLNYESDEYNTTITNSNVDGKVNESVKNWNASSSATGGDNKGKKKGLPAKNLMAERRRRKKLNDRLYMLRSVVPKISKVFFFFAILTVFN